MSEVKHVARKKKLGSYPSISVVASITLALFVIGVFGALVIYSRELERSVKANVRVQVYLKNQIEPEELQKVNKVFTAKYFLPKSSTDAVQFVSKEEAAKKFIQETGENFKKFLGENPLHDAYLLRVDEAYQSKESLAKIKSEIEKMPAVFQVYYVESVIDSINHNITQIGLIVMGLVAVLLIIVVLLINNTMRLALFSQRFLIRSMQLVGAKRWFIQGPFLWRASLHGFVSGVIASGMLAGLISLATKRITELKLIQNNERLVLLMGSLLLLGILVAVISSYRAVNKYLKLSLDELY